MGQSTEGLPEFLLARIAEDEDQHRGHSCQECGVTEAEVLAECEAKRRLVEEFRSADQKVGYRRERDHLPDDFYNGYRAATENILRDFAEVYSKHSDYREDWKP